MCNHYFQIIGIIIILSFYNELVAQTTATQKDLGHYAQTLTEQKVQYDPSYFSIPYPNGDVPAGKGVCKDLVIRAYRLLGTDQSERSMKT